MVDTMFTQIGYLIAGVVESLTGQYGYWFVRRSGPQANGRIWVSPSVWWILIFIIYRNLMIHVRDPLKHWERKKRRGLC